MPLPRTPDEVTPAWLSEALSERFPGTRVRSVDVLEIHHGTNSNARLGVTFEGEPGLPETFFLKMLPLDPERRKTILDTGMGRREALFYRHLADEVPMRVPRPYIALLDERDDLLAKQADLRARIAKTRAQLARTATEIARRR